jgi:hypothetical protein
MHNDMGLDNVLKAILVVECIVILGGQKASSGGVGQPDDSVWYLLRICKSLMACMMGRSGVWGKGKRFMAKLRAVQTSVGKIGCCPR